MGIKVEYNPDLALRDIKHFESGERKEEECIPILIEAGRTYSFLKKDQRLYWLHGEIPLLRTEGAEKLSRPIASIVIKWAQHFLDSGEVFTKGEYEVVKIFDDDEIHFEGYARVKKQELK